jgi:hypothetical protein
MHRLSLATLVILTSVAAFTGATERVQLPAAPEGYRWVRFEEARSAYLRPEGWFLKTELEGQTAALFISKENIDKRGSFETGLTVNIIGEVKPRVGVTPSQYAAAYVEELVKAKEILERFELPPKDGYVGLGVRYRDASKPPAIVAHAYALADDSGDVLRIVVFEAPEAEWDSAWAHGEKIVNGHVWR